CLRDHRRDRALAGRPLRTQPREPESVGTRDRRADPRAERAHPRGGAGRRVPGRQEALNVRLARVESGGEAFWALLDPDLQRLRRIREPFSAWAPALGLGQATHLLGLDDERLELSACRLLPPLQPGARVFGVGLNYRSHLERLGSSPPAHPLAYLKPDSALVGA